MNRDKVIRLLGTETVCRRTFQSIADECGCSRSYVGSVARSLGIISIQACLREGGISPVPRTKKAAASAKYRAKKKMEHEVRHLFITMPRVEGLKEFHEERRGRA